MQTTFSGGLNPSFYGKQIRSGVPAYDNNGGIRTVGGIIGTSNTNVAKFGCALFATTSAPNAFLVGADTGLIFRGILLNRNYVNEQLPAHADHLLNGQPADAIYHGAVWVAVSSLTGFAIGGSLYADDEGNITVDSTNDTAIPGKIIEIDTANKLVLCMIESQ